ncbi:MAG: hypothetical protein CEE38_02300 [Planctomycetes bacterium B3_Pla]|nr:MAG: hypothetical protein CEE38_02300 [Planctomycetes bacterium B3_Pla]
MENYLARITDYLLTQSWQIAVLVVVIAAVTMALKNRSAHVRYLLWLIVLAKCLAPPLFTVSLAVLPQEEATEPVSVSPAQIPSMALEVADAPEADAPVSSASSAAAGPVPTAAKRPARFTLRQWLGLGWLVGAAAFLLIAATKALRTNSWLKRQRKLLPAELKCEIEDLFSDVGVRKFPKVWLVEGIGQPFVWGLQRGSIYLPADFVKVNSAEHRREVLGHELSHVLRFDAAVNLLQIMAQSVFWFHPFVWWANKRIRAEREKCCDETAIAQLGAKAKDYSSAIVNTLINEYESTRPIPSLAIAGPVKNIEERIKTIMKPGKRFFKRPSLITATVVLLLALLTVPTVLVLTARAGTKTRESSRVAGGSLERDADTPESSESNNKVTCSGKVLDTQSRPIVGAKVTAYERNFDMAGNIFLHQVGEVTTTEDGAFSFAAAAKPERGGFDDCYIVAIKQDLALGWVKWGMRENLESNIELGEPEELEGVVVDEAGKPVAGAEVRANLYRPAVAPDERQKWKWLPGIPALQDLAAKADAQGRFVFGNMPADVGVDLLVTAEGKATTYTYKRQSKEATFKAGQTDIRMVLPAEARIEGRIVDPDTGEPLARTKFAVVPSSSGLFYYRFIHTTDDNGAFSIGGLQTGRYHIRDGGFPDTDVDVKSGKTTKLSLQRRSRHRKHYFHVLLDRGSPEVLKPQRKILVRFEHNNGDVRDAGHIDVDGYLKVSLSPKGYREWQLRRARLVASIPYAGGRSFRREEVFSYDDLTKVWPNRMTAKKARPKGELDSLAAKSLSEMKDSGMVLSAEARIEGRIVDWSTSKGIPGATLAIVPHFSPTFSDTLHCVSQEDGTFSARGLRSGKYLIRGDFPSLDVEVESGSSADVLIAVNPKRVAMPRKETPGTSAPGVPIDFYLKIFEVPVGVETGLLEQKESPSNGMSIHKDQEYANRLLELSQDNARAKLIASPRLTIRDRQEGAVVAATEHPYIAGYELAKDGSGKLTPQIKYLVAGSKYKVRGILKSGNRIHVSLAVKQQDPIFETRQYRKGHDYQVPSPSAYFSTDVIAGKNEPVVVGWLRRNKSTLYVVMTASWWSQPESLRGKKLPKLDNIKTEFDIERFEGGPILLCFWDVDQRPSRHCVGRLAEQMEQFREKGVTVVVVQTSKVDEKVLNEWVRKNAVPFPIGIVRGDVEKTKSAWGVQALPWLILADRNHIVSAEGFELGELDEKMKAVAEK